MIVKSQTTGETYFVHFHKVPRTRAIQRPGRKNRKVTTVDTACSIVLGKGISRQHPRDKYDHKLGKWFAMFRAARSLPNAVRADLIAAFISTFGPVNLPADIHAEETQPQEVI